MKALSLFTGIMGIDLACEWAGIKTIAMCERDSYCQKVIRKHKPDIPLYDDICTLTKERLEKDGVITGGQSIDIIHGGYPCQPFSHIGKRAGVNDERHLWPEFFRLIREIRPRWVVGENVSGHIKVGLDQVLTDLESEGYSARAFVLPALSVGSPHERKRVFIVGNSNSKSKSQTNSSLSTIGSEWKSRKNPSWVTGGSLSPSYWSIHQPPVLGVDDGLPNRLERSEALGNAVVPQQIYPILAAIKQIDDMLGG